MTVQKSRCMIPNSYQFPISITNARIIVSFLSSLIPSKTADINTIVNKQFYCIKHAPNNKQAQLGSLSQYEHDSIPQN